MNTQTRKRGNRPVCCRDIGKLIEPRFFKALADPNRIAILERLANCREPCTVSEIGKCCPVNISVVSRHLAMLREAGILDAQKKGKEVYYSVRFAALADCFRQIADAIDDCCPGTRDALVTKTIVYGKPTRKRRKK